MVLTQLYISSTFNNRSFYPTGNGPSGSANCGSLNSYDGPLAGMYQQPNAFSGPLVLQLRKMLDLLEHSSKCCSPNCQYPNCRGVKGLFLHARMCKIRAVGGCVPCRRMWRILQIHSQACKESECHVPRCRDLRVHMRRVQQQSESRRRAAVKEMTRQRVAEVACSS